MSTEGFYSVNEHNKLEYSPDIVQLSSGVVLLREEHTQHTYPVESWTWYESRDIALAANGLEEVEEKEITPNWDLGI